MPEDIFLRNYTTWQNILDDSTFIYFLWFRYEINQFEFELELEYEAENWGESLILCLLLWRNDASLFMIQRYWWWVYVLMFFIRDELCKLISQEVDRSEMKWPRESSIPEFNCHWCCQAVVNKLTQLAISCLSLNANILYNPYNTRSLHMKWSETPVKNTLKTLEVVNQGRKYCGGDVK